LRVAAAVASTLVSNPADLRADHGAYRLGSGHARRQCTKNHHRRGRRSKNLSPWQRTPGKLPVVSTHRRPDGLLSYALISLVRAEDRWRNVAAECAEAGSPPPFMDLIMFFPPQPCAHNESTARFIDPTSSNILLSKRFYEQNADSTQQPWDTRRTENGAWRVPPPSPTAGGSTAIVSFL
jgi:hypothetical protein